MWGPCTWIFTDHDFDSSLIALIGSIMCNCDEFFFDYAIQFLASQFPLCIVFHLISSIISYLMCRIWHMHVEEDFLPALPFLDESWFSLSYFVPPNLFPCCLLCRLNNLFEVNRGLQEVQYLAEKYLSWVVQYITVRALAFGASCVYCLCT